MLRRPPAFASRSPMRALLAAAALAVAATVVPASARAGTFAADGTFLFDPEDIASFDFEGPPEDGGPATQEDPGALSGTHDLPLAPQQVVNLPFAVPATLATYRVSLWVRDNEAIGLLALFYTGRLDELAALYPTGRITSDGWVELANQHLRIDGTTVQRAQVSVFSAESVTVDAVEVVADGDASSFPIPPNAPCDGVADPSACAPDQVCEWSLCRNVGGWVPPIPADRDAVTTYLAARLQFLFGPYLERNQDFPAVDVALDQMQAASDPWDYWNGFLLAIRRLHDGHTITGGLTDYVLTSPKPLAVCFLEGQADLSQSIAPSDPLYRDVLVSHTGTDHNLGLAQGDRLVSIDGQHPIAWARAIIGVNWDQPGISNHSTFAELASGLKETISRYASSLQVIRCPGGVCGPIETISIRDLAPDPPNTPIDNVDCDNRPILHVPGAPPSHAVDENVYSGIVAESQPGEDIYGLEWESLDTPSVGGPLGNAVASWTSGARGVILDHRTGIGGELTADQILWSFAVPARPDDFMQERQMAEDEQPSLAQGMALYQAALAAGNVQSVGSVAPDTGVPVALLLTQDYSASDWLPQGFKGAPNVRLFAPYETNGAFSTRYEFAYWVSQSYVIAVGDDVLPDGSTHCGTGVTPDVVVLPLQSDLVAGKDTVYDAALAWVRQGLAR
jgi:hypothetical protein